MCVSLAVILFYFPLIAKLPERGVYPLHPYYLIYLLIFYVYLKIKKKVLVGFVRKWL